MVSDSLTRDRIPDDLLQAKKVASTQYLSRIEPSGLISASAASTRPEHNVVGVGVGYKITDGVATSQRAVRIYVERKLPRGSIPQEFLIPDALAGVPTDVVETGRFRALPAATPKEQTRIRPVQPGSSIGFQFTGPEAGFVMAGTLGAIVHDGNGSYILSNNHVLANENRLPVGSPIFQSGLLDGGNPATDRVAELTRFVPIDTAHSNEIDCAIAQLVVAFKATLLPRVGRLAAAAPIDAVEGMSVHKVGRTTGYTRGSIFDVSADVTVSYDAGPATFLNQVIIVGAGKPFSAAGDSGSVIVDRATKQAVALLFAGSATHTIANHLSNVLTALAVQLKI